MTGREYTLLGLVLAILGIWMAGARYVDTTMAALVGVAAMVLLGIVSWDDILANKQAWNVLVWFATLVTLASGLAQVKFVEWVGKMLAPLFAGLPPAVAIAVVVGSFFVVHYLFASVTAHTTALLPVFLTVAVALPGMSSKAWALVLAYTFGIMGILTPLATGPSPIYFGSGYIKGRDFWVLGAILGAAFLAALIVIEM